MYILKNALKSITRTKTRNILVGIIIVVIATSSCIALSIKNSATNLINSYKDSYDIEAKLTLNRETMRNDMKNQSQSLGTTKSNFMAAIPELDMNMVTSYGNSKYVKSYSYNVQTQLNGNDITKVTSDDVANSSSNITPPSGEGSHGGNVLGGTAQGGVAKMSGDFTLLGYSNLESMTEFVNSTYKITSGEIFDINSVNNDCIVTDELAEENNLSPGSKITLVNPNKTDETYTLNVVGIYTDSSSSDEFSMFSNSANKILTNYNCIKSIFDISNKATDTKLNLQTNAVFNLINKDVIDLFSSELTAKGLSNYYTVTTNVDSLDESLSPIENLSTFANVFLILVLSIGGAILIIINMINIRERKYEIGVLRAIGMKKYKVLEQFVIELFIVTFISIIIGSTIGAVATVPISNKLLESEISTQEESSNKISENFGKAPGDMGGSSTQKSTDIRNTFSNNKNVKYIDKLNTIIDIKTVAEIVLIGIILTIISSSIAMISISRYKPLNILSSRT